MIVAKLFKFFAVMATAFVLVLGGIAFANVSGFNLFQLGATDRSHPVLLQSIQNVSQYHAAVGNFDVLVDFEDPTSKVEAGLPGIISGQLPDFIAGRRTIFAGAGTVNAYVDFSGFVENDLTYSDDGKTVAVRLPEAKLDKPNLDQERSGVVSQDLGVLDIVNDALTVPDQAKFYKMAEEKIAAAAEESELKKRATENTKAMLTGMFSSMDIQATFRD